MRKILLKGKEIDIGAQLKTVGTVSGKTKLSKMSRDDKAEIVQQVLDALGMVALGRIDADNNVILDLGPGTYYLKNEGSGEPVDLCTVTIKEEA